MMKPVPGLFPLWTRVTSLNWSFTNSTLLLVLFLLSAVAWEAPAQTVVWSDAFIRGEKPSTAQCEKWNNFLGELEGKSFMSVTLSGSNDPVGKTLNDPVAATALAALLSSKTPGTITFGGHSWTVTKCQNSACAGEDPETSKSIALSYDGNTSECDCNDRYAIRPQSTNQDWGGLNGNTSCGAASQSMKLEFSSGVTIVPQGSTAICEGGSVVLTAQSQLCSGELTYLWSNGESTQSITVSQPGDYSVTVSNAASGCTGTSSSTSVRVTEVAVTATASGVYCSDPVQLLATGSSDGDMPATSSTKFCFFDSPDAGPGNCIFTAVDVCLEGMTEVGNNSYSKVVSAESLPSEIQFKLYYTSYVPALFVFKLNGVEIGRAEEINPSGVCDPIDGVSAPRTVSLPSNTFQTHWLDADDNTLTVEISSQGSGFYLAGLTADLVTSYETYTWTPTTGLDVASIRNPLASPSATTIYTVTYKDANGCTAVDQVEVKVDCGTPAPVAICKEVTISLENSCEAVVQASAFDGGSTSGSGAPLTLSVSPEGPYPVGVTEVVLTVTESNMVSSCTTKITVIDPVSPAFPILPDVIVENVDDASCHATIILPVPVPTHNCSSQPVTNDQTDNLFPSGETVVTWMVRDMYGNPHTAKQKVIVKNIAPLIESVEASAATVAIGNPVALGILYADNNVSKATINWGDLTSDQTLTSPGTFFEVAHAYTKAGSYAVTITVIDQCGASAVFLYESIQVIDIGASVTGNGWFDSRPGFYLKDKRSAGKAQFHFDAKFSSMNTVPVGSITFKFKAAKLDFKSTQLESLMVDGNVSMVTGKGKLNGAKGYSILIAGMDQDLSIATSDADKKGKQPKKNDKIRVKIWDQSGKVIYDTQPGDDNNAIATTEIGGGEIEILNSQQIFTEKLDQVESSSFGEESSSVYPNPFTSWLNVQFNAASEENVIVQLLDLTGKVIASEVYPVSEDASYALDVPENAKEGIYVLLIKQGKRTEYLRLVRK